MVNNDSRPSNILIGSTATLAVITGTAAVVAAVAVILLTPPVAIAASLVVSVIILTGLTLVATCAFGVLLTIRTIDDPETASAALPPPPPPLPASSSASSAFSSPAASTSSDDMNGTPATIPYNAEDVSPAAAAAAGREPSPPPSTSSFSSTFSSPAALPSSDAMNGTPATIPYNAEDVSPAAAAAAGREPSPPPSTSSSSIRPAVTGASPRSTPPSQWNERLGVDINVKNYLIDLAKKQLLSDIEENLTAVRNAIISQSNRDPRATPERVDKAIKFWLQGKKDAVKDISHFQTIEELLRFEENMIFYYGDKPSAQQTQHFIRLVSWTIKDSQEIDKLIDVAKRMDKPELIHLATTTARIHGALSSSTRQSDLKQILEGITGLEDLKIDNLIAWAFAMKLGDVLGLVPNYLEPVTETEVTFSHAADILKEQALSIRALRQSWVILNKCSEFTPHSNWYPDSSGRKLGDT